MSDRIKYITLNQDNFETEVIKSNLPVVVDFWAPWCGPCRVMNPIIENLAAEWEGVVKVGKANIDDNSDLATSHHIEAVPTILIFHNGELIDRISGIISKTALEEKLKTITDKVVAM